MLHTLGLMLEIAYAYEIKELKYYAVFRYKCSCRLFQSIDVL